MECDQRASVVLSETGAGVPLAVTSCAIFSSSLGTKLLWFLSPELSAELRQRPELVLLASRLSASLLTTTLAFSWCTQSHMCFSHRQRDVLQSNIQTLEMSQANKTPSIS